MYFLDNCKLYKDCCLSHINNDDDDDDDQGRTERGVRGVQWTPLVLDC